MKTMKKMNVGELKSLSRSEMKNIMAGSGGGSCIGCQCGAMYSCWYTTGDASALCARVYPNCTGYYVVGVVPCGGCTMN